MVWKTPRRGHFKRRSIYWAWIRLSATTSRGSILGFPDLRKARLMAEAET
ncbi:hypothetical protein ACSU1N_05390 [Thermogladius sp. 4427co]